MAHQYWTMQQVPPQGGLPAVDTLVDGLNALDALECALQQPNSGVSPGHLHVFLAMNSGKAILMGVCR